MSLETSVTTEFLVHFSRSCRDGMKGVRDTSRGTDHTSLFPGISSITRRHLCYPPIQAYWVFTRRGLVEPKTFHGRSLNAIDWIRCSFAEDTHCRVLKARLDGLLFFGTPLQDA